MSGRIPSSGAAMTNNRFAPLAPSPSPKAGKRTVLSNRNGRDAPAAAAAAAAAATPSSAKGILPAKENPTAHTARPQRKIAPSQSLQTPQQQYEGNVSNSPSSSFTVVTREKRSKLPRANTFAGALPITLDTSKPWLAAAAAPVPHPNDTTNTNNATKVYHAQEAPVAAPGRHLPTVARNGAMPGSADDQQWRPAVAARPREPAVTIVGREAAHARNRPLPRARTFVTGPPTALTWETRNVGRNGGPQTPSPVVATMVEMLAEKESQLKAGSEAHQKQINVLKEANIRELQEQLWLAVEKAKENDTARDKLAVQVDLVSNINTTMDAVRTSLAGALGRETRASNGTPRQKVDQVHGMVDEILQKLTGYQNELHDKKGLVVQTIDLRTQNVELEKRNANLKTQLDQMKVVTNEVTAKVDDTQRLALEKKISDRDAVVSELQTRLLQVSAESGSSAGENEDIVEELKGLRYTIRQLRSDRAGLKEGAAMLKVSLDRASDTLRKSDAKYKSLKNEFESLQKSSQTKDAELARVQQKAIDPQASAPLVLELKETKRALEEVRQQKSATDVATFKGYQEMTTSLSTMVARNEMLHTKLQEALEAKDLAEQTIAVSSEAVPEGQLEMYRQAVSHTEELRLQIKELERRIIELTKEKDECSAVINEQSILIESQHMACSALKKKIESLESKNNVESLVGKFEEQPRLSSSSDISVPKEALKKDRPEAVTSNERFEKIRQTREASGKQGSFLFGALKGFFPPKEGDDENVGRP